MKRHALGPSTCAIHGKRERRIEGEPITTPIVQSSTFINPVGGSGEVLYTRYGNNPNQVELAKRLAALEGAEAAIFVGSGMGATALAHLTVLRPGDHLLASKWLYGGTQDLFTDEFERLGISVSFADVLSDSWHGQIRKNTRAVFVETPTNPLVRVVDIGSLAGMCRERGLALIVDTTFATPVNLRALEHGADLVIHSATKYLNGHSDVISGAVAGNAEVVEEVRRLLKLWGPAIDPHAAWLVERGMKTLAVRMERHNANAMVFAKWAMEHPKISTVHYPGLADHPDHAIAGATMDGFGGMVGLQIDGGIKASEQMLHHLRLASHAPSLGGVETLVCEPRLTSHARLSAEERQALGIPDGFVRVSVGLEDVQDIIDDFDQALAAR
jgi:cystathionine beta-lyase/cystathionine gamma-synthase